jgi:predicted class III extradiol MEMO1 family dioxygenase
MEHIELHDIEKFQDYLKETENNICGKHVISILLNVTFTASSPVHSEQPE